MSAPVGSDRPFLNRRLAAFGTTIFAEMSALAARTGSINLGQGFPDTDGPAEIAEAASRAVLTGLGNQYPPGPGVPELRTAIASHQQRFYGLGYDPDTEVLVTAGATEAIAASLLALLEPGDEVIALEPFYDSYAACIAMAGATRVPVTLRPHGDAFALDLDELRAAVTPRTRLLLLNTPHNPTGTVLTPGELAAVAALAVERDLLVVTDEVYEHLVFEGSHTPWRASPACASARSPSAARARRTRSRAGRSAGSPHRRSSSRRSARRSSSSPTSPRAPSSTPSPRPCTCRTPTTTPSAPTSPPSATSSPTASRRPASRSSARAAPTSSPPTSPPRREGRPRLLPRPARALRGRRHPEPGLLRRQVRRRHTGPMGVLQADGCFAGGGRAPR